MNKKRAYQVSLKGAKETHGDARALVRAPGDIAFVERGRLRGLVCACPCGCGDIITINLDRRAGKAWILYRRKGSISLYPSIWRDSGCESHFIVLKSRVLWCEGDWLFMDEQIDQLSPQVLSAMPMHGFVHFKDIAEQLDEIPWTVLRVCRKLAKRGIITEGREKFQGYFMRSR